MLYMDSNRSRLPFNEAYIASIQAYPIRVSIKRDELVARSSEVALEFSQDLFKRFGWSPSLELMRDWQERRD
jgi:hypothetical protein